MVICLERGADLHMAQLMPLPFTICCFSKIQIGFWYWLTWVVPEKGPLNGFVCVCVYLLSTLFTLRILEPIESFTVARRHVLFTLYLP